MVMIPHRAICVVVGWLAVLLPPAAAAAVLASFKASSALLPTC